MDEGILKTIKNRGTQDSKEYPDIALNEKTKSHVVNFLSAMIPKKSYKCLEEFRDTTLKQKSRDVLPFLRGIGQKFKSLAGSGLDKFSSSQSSLTLDLGNLKLPLNEPEPEIFNLSPEAIDLDEKDARIKINSNRSHRIDHKPIFVPKSKRPPHIDMEL